MNKYETLKKKIMANSTYETKRKLVKTLKKDILKAESTIKIGAMEVGVHQENVFAIIHSDYINAQMIKEALKGNKALSVIKVMFKVDDSYPKELVKENQFMDVK